MSRPYFDYSVDELATIVDEQRHESMVLRDVLEELKHRKTPKAKQLKNEVVGMLEGRVKLRPEEPPEDSVDSQLDMLGTEDG